MPAGIQVANIVRHKRLELRNGDQKIVVDRKQQRFFVPFVGEMRARFRNDRVYVLLGTKALEMTTPVAAKVGFALTQNGGACFYQGDVVSFQIGGEEFCLLPEQAIQLGGVMLKKTDRADDWQRDNPLRRVAT
jgi:hypothetical protein